MTEPLADRFRWRPRRSTAWLAVAMTAGVIHSLLEQMQASLAGLFLAVAMIAMLHAGMHLQKENDG